MCSSIIQEQLTWDSGSPWRGTSIYIFLMRFYAWFHFCGLHLTALLCRSTNKAIHHNWNMFLVPALADKGAVKLRRRSIEPEIWAWLPTLALFGTRYSVSWTSTLGFSSHQRRSSAYCLAFLPNTWGGTRGQALGKGGQQKIFYFAVRSLALGRKIRKSWLFLLQCRSFYFHLIYLPTIWFILDISLWIFVI